MPMEYIVPSLRIEVVTRMSDQREIEERMMLLVFLEEDCNITGFNQHV